MDDFVDEGDCKSDGQGGGGGGDRGNIQRGENRGDGSVISKGMNSSILSLVPDSSFSSSSSSSSSLSMSMSLSAA